MCFVIKTVYDQRAMTVMARTLRKTLRRNRSRRIHIFAGVVLVSGILLLAASLRSGDGFHGNDWVTLLAVLVIAVTLFTQDTLNGWIARKLILPGMEEAEAVFTDEEFVSATKTAQTHWKHEQVKAVYETKDYFVFFLSKQHGQVYDKRGFLEGTPEEFRTFLREKTGKPVEYIK